MLDLLEAYRSLFLIRRAEEEIVARYAEGMMRCPTHLSIGQEAAAVGVIMALQTDDHVYSAHRSHAHYIAKGGDLDSFVAELYGKATGCAGGWGGSMHLADESVGFIGTSAIVGSSIGIATGSAMAFQMDGSERAAVAFVGDAGVETGVFWESVNFAVLHELPLMWVCENNGYATATPISARQPPSAIAARVAGFGLSIVQASDTDIEDLYDQVLDARAHLPAFVEISTYRYLEHVGPNTDWDQGYRTEAEVRSRMAEDVIPKLHQRLLQEGNGASVAKIEEEAEQRVLAAFERAEAAPWPTWSDNPAIDPVLAAHLDSTQSMR